VVLGLVLHASHHQQPEQILLGVVSAGLDLMVNVRLLWVVLMSDFLLMVANEDKCSVESSNEFTDDPIHNILPEDVETGVVAEDEGEIDLHNSICT
jgi:hypothetical protein